MTVAQGDWVRGHRAKRIGFVAVVLFWTAVGEDLPAGGWRFWYGREIIGVPAHYFYLAGGMALLLPFILGTPRRSLIAALTRTRITPWVLVAWAAVTIALTRAIVDSAPDPFVDWRDLAVVAVVAAVALRLLAAQPWRRWALTDLAIGYGMVAIPFLVAWLMGYGVSILGVRIPTFHSALLYMAVFASLALVLVWSTSINSAPPGYRFLVRLGAVTSSALVVLSFRRSWWLAWAVGMVAVLYILLRRRWSSTRGALSVSVLLAGVVIAAFLFLGTEIVVARLASFVPTADNEFTATNEDHFNDIRDALAVVSREPVLGFGIGKFYETNLISDWKTESFDVHNAFLHAWLKFGILGAIAYLGFHVAWVRASWQESRVESAASPALTATAFYVAGNLIGTVVGTWPYRSIQLAIFHGILLAGLALAVLDNHQSRQVAVLAEA